MRRRAWDPASPFLLSTCSWVNGSLMDSAHLILLNCNIHPHSSCCVLSQVAPNCHSGSRAQSTVHRLWGKTQVKLAWKLLGTAPVVLSNWDPPHRTLPHLQCFQWCLGAKDHFCLHFRSSFCPRPLSITTGHGFKVCEFIKQNLQLAGLGKCDWARAGGDARYDSAKYLLLFISDTTCQ